MTTLELLRPLLLALAVAGASMAALPALSRKWRGKGWRERALLWFPVTAGYLAGVGSIRGIPAFPPGEAAGWLFYGAAAAALASVAIPWPRTAFWTWLTRVVVAAVLLSMLLQPIFRHEWTVGEGFVWLGGLGFYWLACWGTWARAAESSPINTWVVIGLPTGGLAALLLISGSATLSQNSLALAGAVAAFGIYLLIAKWLPGRAEKLPLAMAGILWPGLLISGFFYAEMEIMSAVFLAAGAMACLWGRAPWIRGKGAWFRWGAVYGWTLVMIGLSLARAWQQAPDLYY